MCIHYTYVYCSGCDVLYCGKSLLTAWQYKIHAILFLLNSWLFLHSTLNVKWVYTYRWPIKYTYSISFKAHHLRDSFYWNSPAKFHSFLAHFPIFLMIFPSLSTFILFKPTSRSKFVRMLQIIFRFILNMYFYLTRFTYSYHVCLKQHFVYIL